MKRSVSSKIIKTGLYNCISFRTLSNNHFPLLCKWLNTSYVHKWWGENREWSLQDVENKYSSYAEGYKLVNGIEKPIYPYIIQYNDDAIGYIQYYNAYNFSLENNLFFKSISSSLASLDIYIGEEKYLGKGLGSVIVEKLLQEHIWKSYTACFVSPEKENITAIKVYNKIGFKNIIQNQDHKVNWMIKIKDEDEIQKYKDKDLGHKSY